MFHSALELYHTVTLTLCDTLGHSVSLRLRESRGLWHSTTVTMTLLDIRILGLLDKIELYGFKTFKDSITLQHTRGA